MGPMQLQIHQLSKLTLLLLLRVIDFIDSLFVPYLFDLLSIFFFRIRFTFITYSQQTYMIINILLIFHSGIYVYLSIPMMKLMSALTNIRLHVFSAQKKIKIHKYFGYLFKK